MAARLPERRLGLSLRPAPLLRAQPPKMKAAKQRIAAHGRAKKRRPLPSLGGSLISPHLSAPYFTEPLQRIQHVRCTIRVYTVSSFKKCVTEKKHTGRLREMSFLSVTSLLFLLNHFYSVCIDCHVAQADEKTGRHFFGHNRRADIQSALTKRFSSREKPLACQHSNTGRALLFHRSKHDSQMIQFHLSKHRTYG